MPQLNTYVEMRVAAWALWVKWGSSGKPSGLVSWFESVVMAPNVQGRGGDHQACPVDEALAYEINRCMMVLPEHLRDTVKEHWLYAGTVEMKAQRLRISRDQFYERLNVAYNKILGYLNDLAAGVALPAPEISHGLVKKRRARKPLTLSDTLRTFRGRLA